MPSVGAIHLNYFLQKWYGNPGKPGVAHTLAIFREKIDRANAVIVHGR
jgi:hypothetical protein